VQEWRSWLRENADRGTGVWLVSWKRTTGRPAITYEEAIEEALTVGWVDSTAGTLDDERSMLWFAPRKRGSGWSRPNKQRLERLRARTAHAGAGARSSPAQRRRLLDAARRRGRASSCPATCAAFAERPAPASSGRLPRSVKRAQLEQGRCQAPETRARRIAAVADGAPRRAGLSRS
jgi:uncharacterized protein YdeI (YjbR/CyaY-like superfamily)